MEKMSIIYCCNRQYITGLQVSLLSLLMSHKPYLSQLQFFIVLDTEVKHSAIVVIKNILSTFKVDYKVLHIKDIVSNKRLGHLQEEYGFNWLNGLNKVGIDPEYFEDRLPKLDKSAYYRIYGMHYLLEQATKTDKFLYLDSDTLIIDSLMSLLSGYNDFAIYARLDNTCGPITNAKNANNLKQYFNSGVLLLNNCIESLELLTNCISIVENSTAHQLFFQDQCALNIAFNNSFGELDDKYNYFICPHNSKTNNSRDKVVLHFLDKPKPWQDNYKSTNDDIGSIIIYQRYIKKIKMLKKGLLY